MKIIHHGKDPKDRVYRVTCVHCHCVYEFQRHEAGSKPGGQIDGETLVTKCPTCKHEAWTKANPT